MESQLTPQEEYNAMTTSRMLSGIMAGFSSCVGTLLIWQVIMTVAASLNDQEDDWKTPASVRTLLIVSSILIGAGTYILTYEWLRALHSAKSKSPQHNLTHFTRCTKNVTGGIVLIVMSMGIYALSIGEGISHSLRDKRLDLDTSVYFTGVLACAVLSLMLACLSFYVLMTLRRSHEIITRK